MSGSGSTRPSRRRDLPRRAAPARTGRPAHSRCRSACGDGRRPASASPLLSGQEQSWLIQRIRARLERGQPLAGSVTLHHPTDAQRQALERLLGRRPGRGTSISVDLRDLEAVVAHAGVAPDLPTAIVALTGPLTDRAAERAAAETVWAAAFEPTEQAAADRGGLEAWVAWLRDTGMLRRLSGGDPAVARALAEQATTVLARLPADSTPLSVLAATTLGDGHGAGRRPAAQHHGPARRRGLVRHPR